MSGFNWLILVTVLFALIVVPLTNTSKNKAVEPPTITTPREDEDEGDEPKKDNNDEVPNRQAFQDLS